MSRFIISALNGAIGIAAAALLLTAPVFGAGAAQSDTPLPGDTPAAAEHIKPATKAAHAGKHGHKASRHAHAGKHHGRRSGRTHVAHHGRAHHKTSKPHKKH